MASTSIDMEKGYPFERKGLSIADDFAYGTNVATSHIYIRMEIGVLLPFGDALAAIFVYVYILAGFLRKVYGILSIQLLVTTLTAAALKFTPTVRAYVSQNPWMLSVGLIGSLVILFALHVYRRKAPLNYFLLAAFTLIEAYSIGIIVTFYDQILVLQAFVITAVITVCLTVYTLQSKRDFNSWGTGLFVGMCILLTAGIFQIFLGSTFLELVISAGGALLFAMFLMYDTQQIMNNLSPEEYILATITLYLDIFNLFLHILRFLEAMKRN